MVGRTNGEITDAPELDASESETSAFFARFDDSTGDGQFDWAEQVVNSPFAASAGFSIAIDNDFVNPPLFGPMIYITGDVSSSFSAGFPIGCGFADVLDQALGLQEFKDMFAARFDAFGDYPIKGDTNGDGRLTLLDLAAFVAKLSSYPDQRLVGRPCNQSNIL